VFVIRIGFVCPNAFFISAQHSLERLTVMHVGGRELPLADYFAFHIYPDMPFVTEKFVSVFLGTLRLRVYLRTRLALQFFPLLFAQRTIL